MWLSTRTHLSTFLILTSFALLPVVFGLGKSAVKDSCNCKNKDHNHHHGNDYDIDVFRLPPMVKTVVVPRKIGGTNVLTSEKCPNGTVKITKGQHGWWEDSPMVYFRRKRSPSGKLKMKKNKHDDDSGSSSEEHIDKRIKVTQVKRSWICGNIKDIKPTSRRPLPAYTIRNQQTRQQTRGTTPDDLMKIFTFINTNKNMQPRFPERTTLEYTKPTWPREFNSYTLRTSVNYPFEFSNNPTVKTNDFTFFTKNNEKMSTYSSFNKEYTAQTSSTYKYTNYNNDNDNRKTTFANPDSKIFDKISTVNFDVTREIKIDNRDKDDKSQNNGNGKTNPDIRKDFTELTSTTSESRTDKFKTTSSYFDSKDSKDTKVINNFTFEKLSTFSDVKTNEDDNKKTTPYTSKFEYTVPTRNNEKNTKDDDDDDTQTVQKHTETYKVESTTINYDKYTKMWTPFDHKKDEKYDTKVTTTMKPPTLFTFTVPKTYMTFSFRDFFTTTTSPKQLDPITEKFRPISLPVFITQTNTQFKLLDLTTASTTRSNFFQTFTTPSTTVFRTINFNMFTTLTKNSHSNFDVITTTKIPVQHTQTTSPPFITSKSRLDLFTTTEITVIYTYSVHKNNKDDKTELTTIPTIFIKVINNAGGSVESNSKENKISNNNISNESKNEISISGTKNYSSIHNSNAEINSNKNENDNKSQKDSSKTYNKVEEEEEEEEVESGSKINKFSNSTKFDFNNKNQSNGNFSSNTSQWNSVTNGTDKTFVSNFFSLTNFSTSYENNMNNFSYSNISLEQYNSSTLLNSGFSNDTSSDVLYNLNSTQNSKFNSSYDNFNNKSFNNESKHRSDDNLFINATYHGNNNIRNNDNDLREIKTETGKTEKETQTTLQSDITMSGSTENIENKFTVTKSNDFTNNASNKVSSKYNAVGTSSTETRFTTEQDASTSTTSVYKSPASSTLSDSNESNKFVNKNNAVTSSTETRFTPEQDVSTSTTSVNKSPASSTLSDSNDSNKVSNKYNAVTSSTETRFTPEQDASTSTITVNKSPASSTLSDSNDSNKVSNKYNAVTSFTETRFTPEQDATTSTTSVNKSTSSTYTTLSDSNDSNKISNENNAVTKNTATSSRVEITETTLGTKINTVSDSPVTASSDYKIYIKSNSERDKETTILETKAYTFTDRTITPSSFYRNKQETTTYYNTFTDSDFNDDKTVSNKDKSITYSSFSKQETSTITSFSKFDSSNDRTTATDVVISSTRGSFSKFEIDNDKTITTKNHSESQSTTQETSTVKSNSKFDFTDEKTTSRNSVAQSSQETVNYRSLNSEPTLKNNDQTIQSSKSYLPTEKLSTASQSSPSSLSEYVTSSYSGTSTDMKTTINNASPSNYITTDSSSVSTFKNNENTIYNKSKTTSGISVTLLLNGSATDDGENLTTDPTEGEDPEKEEEEEEDVATTVENKITYTRGPIKAPPQTNKPILKIDTNVKPVISNNKLDCTTISMQNFSKEIFSSTARQVCYTQFEKAFNIGKGGVMLDPGSNSDEKPGKPKNSDNNVKQYEECVVDCFFRQQNIVYGKGLINTPAFISLMSSRLSNQFRGESYRAITNCARTVYPVKAPHRGVNNQAKQPICDKQALIMWRCVKKSISKICKAKPSKPTIHKHEKRVELFMGVPLLGGLFGDCKCKDKKSEKLTTLKTITQKPLVMSGKIRSRAGIARNKPLYAPNWWTNKTKIYHKK